MLNLTRLNLLFLFALLLCFSGCAREPRAIVGEPLEIHDLQKDKKYCTEFAGKFGVVDMEPVMPGSDTTEFSDGQRQVQLYESCMLKKGYRF